MRALFFFFNDTATTEIYTLSLHDALPISAASTSASLAGVAEWFSGKDNRRVLLVSDGFHMLRLRIIANRLGDRKSTRLNSSHLVISYAVFCLKKKKKHLKVNLCTSYIPKT